MVFESHQRKSKLESISKFTEHIKSILKEVRSVRVKDNGLYLFSFYFSFSFLFLFYLDLGLKVSVISHVIVT